MRVIYGVNPLREAFLSHPETVEKVVVAGGRGGEATKQILQMAEERGIPVEFASRERVERLAPHRTHQGIVGLCQEHDYASLEEVIANRNPAFQNNLVVILDSVTDPQNLGSIIRTAHCFGANGVIIPENRAASITPSVTKASAGAAHHLPTAKVVNLTRTIEQLKEQGFWVYGADALSQIDVQTPDYNGSVALVMGSEGQGLRSLVRKQCDFLISIPMRGQVASLNVAVATGVILYEIIGKWGKGV